ncbi:Dienelactone hydrolase [Zhouia amylolytica]|uniref:Dienelactone hydrolase n=1 Tax=Zhouia amylolytica TaxID=376730 RepID=A0A1I6UL47_9FLAO|nr:dienelactone hydrolase family protein [Zhouia amylolytica]MCQ0112689.1 dienelactone hydrolase family protein [Zhouia amylolytica]SFT02185.1 Dienelactone hydrolase [Zhouia amylolytica]
MRLYKSAFILLLGILFITGCKQKKQEAPQSEDKPSVVVDVKGEVIKYAVDTTNLQGYLAYDAGKKGKRPGILIVHEWWGHNDYVRHRADMLAELGYTTLALDMYGDGKQAMHPDDAGKFAQQVMGNIGEAKKRFDVALKLLKEQPSVDSTRIAAIGYCFGGSVALTMANMGADLDAVAAFHSGVQLPVMPNKDLKATVLVCNGADDPFINKESVTAFKAQLDSLNIEYKYVEYPGVVHSFTSKVADSLGNKFNLPLKYDAEADRKSWNELKNLLNEVFNESM